MKWVVRSIGVCTVLYSVSATAQGVAEAESINNLIQSSGGWGLSALLMIVLAIVVRDNIKQRDKLLEQHGQQHAALFSMLEKKIQSDVLHEQSFRELRVMIEKWLEKHT